MQKWWREHHIVPSIPKFRVILSIESESVSGSYESKSSYNEDSCQEIEEHARVVKGAILGTKESGEHRSNDWNGVVDLNPKVVNNSEGSVKSVLAILPRAHFNSLENSANKSWSFTKSLIN